MKALLLAPLLTLLAACQVNDALSAPALLVDPDETSRRVLQDAIMQMIGGEPVLLADDVLTTSSELFIQQAVLRDNQGRPIMGRHTQPAYRFELRIDNGDCVLVNPGLNKRVELTGVECKPAG